MNITARVTGRGARTRHPHAPGATEAALTIGGVIVGIVTLRHNEHEQLIIARLGLPTADGATLDHEDWCTKEYAATLRAMDDAEQRATMLLIERAVRNADSPAAMAIHRALGVVGFKESALLVGERRNHWTNYCNARTSPTGSKLAGWLGRLADQGREMTITRTVDGCVAHLALSCGDRVRRRAAVSEPRRRAIVWGRTTREAQHRAREAGLDLKRDQVVLLSARAKYWTRLVGLDVGEFEAIGMTRAELNHARYGVTFDPTAPEPPTATPRS